MTRRYNPNVPMSTKYSRHKAQAKSKGEPYELTESEFRMLWATQGITERDQRPGRRSNSVSMVRRDRSLPWRVDNITFMTRKQYIQLWHERHTHKSYMVAD